MSYAQAQRKRDLHLENRNASLKLKNDAKVNNMI